MSKNVDQMIFQNKHTFFNRYYIYHNLSLNYKTFVLHVLICYFMLLQVFQVEMYLELLV